MKTIMVLGILTTLLLVVSLYLFLTTSDVKHLTFACFVICFLLSWLIALIL